jgi:hypothetical protein
MAEYMTAWIATSTQRNYNAYVRYYLSFCSEFNLRPLQPDEANSTNLDVTINLTLLFTEFQVEALRKRICAVG